MSTLACARILWCGVPLVLITTQIVGAAPQDARAERATALALSAGRSTFSQFCAPCHGIDGKGHGPIAPDLLTLPADLTQMNRRNDGAFPLVTFEAVLTRATRPQTPAHRSEHMPIWGPMFLSIDSSETLARARVANLLAYIESIQQ